jgi:TetR/AcrR family transcriptional regulator, regulator of cefoperazone and chloramphenicol sensitivity
MEEGVEGRMTVARRRKTGSGYPRGEETRARIIRAALALFGERGFDGVSTRDIAAQAGVPAPSLQYYFENKEGLYAACIEDIQMSANAAVGPALEVVEGMLRDKASTGAIIDAYCSMLDGLADFLFASPDATSRALFIARRVMPEKATMMRSDVSKGPGSRLHECCSKIIAYISDGAVAAEERGMMALAINGQLLTFHFARDHLKFLLGYDEITPERLAALKAIVRGQTTVLLKACRKAAGGR